MAISITTHLDRPPNRPVLTVIGELDLATAADVPSPPVGAGLDLRWVPFVDAAGVGRLVEAAAGRPLDVVASPAVERIVALCGLGEVLRLRRPDAPPALADAAFRLLVVDEGLCVVHDSFRPTGTVRYPLGLGAELSSSIPTWLPDAVADAVARRRSAAYDREGVESVVGPGVRIHAVTGTDGRAGAVAVIDSAIDRRGSDPAPTTG